MAVRDHVLGLNDEYQLLLGVPGCPKPQCPMNLDCRCHRLRVEGWVIPVADSYELVEFWSSCYAGIGLVLIVWG